MNLAARIVTEKRLAVGTAGAVLLAAALLHGLVVGPLRSGMDLARARARSASHALAAGEAGLAAARTRLAGAARARESLDAFHRGVLPNDLAAARALTYPRLAALAGRLGLDLERRTSEAEPVDGGRLGRLRANLFLAGDYMDVRRFIDALETAPEFVVIEEIALSRRPDAADAKLALTLGLSTYYWTESGE